jgi:uncharacterized protein YndB with AHSA1/START domain
MTTKAEIPAIQITRSIAATPERVFDAWLDPEMARRFLFATPTGELVRVEIDGRVGGQFTIVRREHDRDIEHVGEYLTIDRPRKLVFTFGVPAFSAQFTEVTVEVEPAAGGCTLTLTHEGVPSEWVERTRDGWGGILTGLDAALR